MLFKYEAVAAMEVRMFFLIVEEVEVEEGSDTVDYFVSVIEANETYECEGGLVIVFGYYTTEADADVAYAETREYIESDDDKPPKHIFPDDHCIIWARQLSSKEELRVEATLGLEYESTKDEVLVFLGVEKEEDMNQRIFNLYADKVGSAEESEADGQPERLEPQGVFHTSMTWDTVGES